MAASAIRHRSFFRRGDRRGAIGVVSTTVHCTSIDEIVGPVLSTTRVATYDEAIQLVNTNPYANGVALFTNDGGAARKFQHEVEVGMVGNTVPIPVPSRWPDPRHRGVDLGFPTNT